MSNDGSLAFVCCLFVGYKFASVLGCVGLVVSDSIEISTTELNGGKIVKINQK